MRIAAVLFFALLASCGVIRKDEQKDVGINVQAICEGCKKCELYLQGEGIERDDGTTVTVEEVPTINN